MSKLSPALQHTAGLSPRLRQEVQKSIAGLSALKVEFTAGDKVIFTTVEGQESGTYTVSGRTVTIEGIKNEKGFYENMVGTLSSDGRAIVMGHGSGFKLIRQQ
ncbi:MAG: hypothetical protein ACYC96_04650 [Fimbriimonadaceae bacterium]